MFGEQATTASGLRPAFCMAFGRPEKGGIIISHNAFSQLGLAAALGARLAAGGITSANSLQQAVIPALLAGQDAVLEAPTGSGKTLAFVLPLVQRGERTLVVTPTRELAQQIAVVVEQVSGAAPLLVYGGGDWQMQAAGWQGEPRWIVATPGRLLAQVRQGVASLAEIKQVVLDEADQLLAADFWPDVAEIMEAVMAEAQRVVVSATLPEALLERFALHEPLVWRGRERSGIRQILVNVAAEDKANRLCRILNEQCYGQAVVFCRTHWRAERLAQLLMQRGYWLELLHGQMTQRQREAALERFRAGEVQVLVATELAARGLDVVALSHVVNYDVARETAAYVHRIGRTGRAGATGVAYTLAAPREWQQACRLAAELGFVWETEDGA